MPEVNVLSEANIERLKERVTISTGNVVVQASLPVLVTTHNSPLVTLNSKLIAAC